ncbi:hypothetical protein PG996_007550 [Apiospora saccharicola]|uniref:Uncharacterized protein n=1 Tax=Apiospora saccharicola TaxID=335842 RepID=A0ABR1VB81_9PEZI
MRLWPSLNTLSFNTNGSHRYPKLKKLPFTNTVADSNSVDRFDYFGTTSGSKLYQKHRRTMFRCVLVEGHPDLVNDASLVLLLLLCSRLLSPAGRTLTEIKEESVQM